MNVNSHWKRVAIFSAYTNDDVTKREHAPLWHHNTCNWVRGGMKYLVRIVKMTSQHANMFLCDITIHVIGYAEGRSIVIHFNSGWSTFGIVYRQQTRVGLELTEVCGRIKSISGCLFQDLAWLNMWMKWSYIYYDCKDRRKNKSKPIAVASFVCKQYNIIV